ncbi:hypothetical protein B0H21DRAFT_719718 [Amylocystis lapponica]|nr:hypothetical protein B0H21DRAFT_719718 [Amylocystis lapponica]
MGVDVPKEGAEQKTDFRKDIDVWWTDGSVVFIAETTAFRVHASIMAATCEIFRDMFTMPQPEDIDTYEGCQVVRLHDSAADLKHFLKAIYEFKWYFRPGVKNRFPVVAAVLRLSTKYHAVELRQRAIDLLVTAYPSTFAAWDQRASNRLVLPFEGEFSACVTAALDGDIRVILPAVYYAASRQPLSELLSELRILSITLSSNAHWDVFSDFLLGREWLERAELKEILDFLSPHFSRPHCRDGGRDNDLLKDTAKRVARKVDVVDSYHQWCSAHPGEVGKSIGLCDRCCEMIGESIQRGRLTVWEQLPTFFGLADWETLKVRDVLNDSD